MSVIDRLIPNCVTPKVKAMQEAQFREVIVIYERIGHSTQTRLPFMFQAARDMHGRD